MLNYVETIEMWTFGIIGKSCGKLEIHGIYHDEEIKVDGVLVIKVFELTIHIYLKELRINVMCGICLHSS